MQLATGRTLPIFGQQFFAAGRFDPVQATQVPEGYVLGPGDELIVQVYGGLDFTERLVVGRDGRITVPRVGPVQVAGLRFGELEAALTRSLSASYRNFKLAVGMGRLRSIEIYLVGQAASPGRKVVSSLSTLINALFETGGPSVQGSLRAIELRRRGRTVSTLDLYDFIARGNSSADQPLEPGDIIFIPPAGPQVALVGALNQPAIYELPKGGGNIGAMLALSGGLPALAAPQLAQLERVDASRVPARYVENLALDAAGLAKPLQAGDIVTAYSVSPQIANAVTLQGNVASPMRYAHKPGMRVTDLVADNNFLVPVSYWLRVNAGNAIPGLDKPEVNFNYATVQRLDPVTLRTEVIPFDLAKALSGHAADNLLLKPGDLVRIYGPDEEGVNAFQSVILRSSIFEGPRRFVWREGYRISDALPAMERFRQEVVRWVRSGRREVQAGTARTGFSAEEVNFDYAQVTRTDPAALRTEILAFNLRQALEGNATENLMLKPGDQITLFTTRQVQIPLARRTRVVQINGEVAVPGTYQVNPGEKLTDLIRRAGGFTRDAFVYGTVFTRESTRQEQRRNLDQLVKTLEADLISQSAALAQNTAQVQADAQTTQAQLAAQKAAVERLRTLEVSGRIALDLDDAVGSQPLPALELEDGDTITVPTNTDFIGVFGAVDISSAMRFRSGQTVRDYLERAGLRRFADIENVAVLRADGTVRTASTRARGSFFGGGDSVLALEVKRGDSLLVPEVVDRRTAYTRFITGAKDWTQILYQFGLGAAALKTIRN
ncbi:MAG: polysaccharide biosynthesis/export family protein [Burkholderiales bacterium]